MKCPECQNDQKVKYGLVCKCGYRFTFNPKVPSSHRLTDGKFRSAISKASQNGTAYFTVNQLYAAYASKLKPPKFPLLLGSVIALIVGVVLISQGVWFGALVLAVAVGLFISAFTARPSVMSRSQFDHCLKRWQGDGKAIEGLLEFPALQAAPDEWPEDDIYDYGAERILIVQRDLLVDLFVKNNQHAEQRMLVIAESGYPEYLRPHVNQLLAERGDLPVFLLHDADASGRTMEQRVRSLAWLKLGSHPLVDLGMFPSDFAKLKRTANYDVRDSERALPADALLIGSLGVGMAACFASRTTFGDQLLQEKKNVAESSSSFG